MHQGTSVQTKLHTIFKGTCTRVTL